ncbi:hypothetical protein GXM21_07960 [Megamonas funiformis]|jgi:hypothetical protein|uniref:Uncharacterized protein n=1 Tax=Megamonas funiformis YIT 11815 TaxID=742816 RepID=A0ABP2NME6_9FIRM|nr:hypothetical protein [Megamonas funiformis]EHR38936.1 hypothetical protein HMPREF9454_00329 [Megamonas funiformis YIT 11815]QIB60328.1 hypothetical protein GXM21_07960 [Megamonas funiformis]
MTKLNNKIINEIKALKLKMMNTTNLLATFESYGFILNDIDIDSSLVIFKHKFDYEIILKLKLISKDIFCIEDIKINHNN